MRFIKNIVPLIILFAGLFIFQPSFAQNAPGGVLVYPNRVNLDFTDPDKQFVSSGIYVENPGKATVRVRSYLQDWDLNEIGGLKFYEEPEETLGERTLIKAVKFNPREFDLAPGQKQLVRLTAKLPEGSEGEFRTMIFFETVSTREQLTAPQKNKLTLMVNFKTRIGVALYALKGKVDPKIDLANFATGDRDGKNVLIATLKNDGNMHTYINGTITLKGADGKKQELKLPSYTMLPERSQDWIIDLSNKTVPAGEYTANLNVKYKDFQGKEYPLAAETKFSYAGSKANKKDTLKDTDFVDEIKLTPENLATPEEPDTTEIKLEPSAN